MSIRDRGLWRIVIKLDHPRDGEGNAAPFTQEDADAVDAALKEVPGSTSVKLEEGALRMVVMTSEKSAQEAWGIATHAAGAAIFSRPASPQLWEVTVHTTGEYVTTKQD